MDYARGLPIYSAPYDQALDNSEYFLDQQQLLVSDCWYRWSTSETGGYQNVYFFHVIARDVCDVADEGSTITFDAYLRYWTSGAGVNLEWDLGAYDLDNNTIGANSSFLAGTTTPTWVQLPTGGGFDIETNGEVNYFLLKAYAASAGTVYIGGLAIYA
jgi:hypothetical protein